MNLTYNPLTREFNVANLAPPVIYNNNGMTTLRERLTRLATTQQKTGNIWTKPWMKCLQVWQPSTSYTLHDTVVNNNMIYICIIGGTSSVYPGGPTTTSTGGTTDGTITWMYWKENKVTTDPYVSQPAWAQSSSSVAVGGFTVANGNVYFAMAIGVYTFTVSGVTVTPTAGSGYTNNGKNFIVLSANITAGSGTIVCTSSNGAPTSSGTLTKAFGTGDATITFASVATANTTAASGTGPSGTGNVIVDNGYVWSFYGLLAANPYAGSIPNISFLTLPSLGNLYTNSASQSFSCLAAFPRGTGSNYNVGDTITISAGNGSQTTAIVLTVATVAGGVPQTVTITNPGLFTTLQSNNSYWSQGSTSGSGTGETFTLGFNEAGWCSLNGVMPSCNLSTYYGGGFTFVPSANASGTIQHWSMEFYSESDIVQMAFALYNNANLSIDDVMYSPGVNFAVTTNKSYVQLDFTQAGGVKPRRFKVSSTTGTNLGGVLIKNNYTIWKPNETERIKAVFITDSLDAGSSYGPFVGGNSTAQRIAEELGWRDIWAMTQGGTGYINRGANPGAGSDNYASRIPQGMAVNPDIWLFMGSSNDIGNTQAAIQAAAVSTYQAIRAAGSKAPIVVFGCWSYNNAGVATVEAALQAAVTQFADPLGRTFYIPIYNDPFFPWVQGTWNNNPAPSGLSNSAALNGQSYIGGDSLHPPDAGTEYLGTRMAQAMIQKVIPYINM